MLLSKGNILLKLKFIGTEVRITPIVREFDNKELLDTFARNEELLTQLYINLSNTNNPLVKLIDYYKQRGWHVETLNS